MTWSNGNGQPKKITSIPSSSNKYFFEMENFVRTIQNKYSIFDDLWQTWARSGNFLRLELKNIQWKNKPAHDGKAYVPTRVSVFIVDFDIENTFHLPHLPTHTDRTLCQCCDTWPVDHSSSICNLRALREIHHPGAVHGGLGLRINIDFPVSSFNILSLCLLL